jgi:hypothetical protein
MNCSILPQLAFVMLAATFASVGASTHEYKVLPPITKGRLTLFPIVGGAEANTAQLLTLDEGVRSGAVVVTEAGSLQGLIRPGTHYPPSSEGEVNRLVLVNNSDRPLLLLAGEVVTGGKQDRVIGVDRIVPPKSAPIDLSVFCVEPGRWVATSEHFSSMTSAMAQPSLRMPAMAARDQHRVWDEVASAADAMGVAAAQGGPVGHGTTLLPSLLITTACCTIYARWAPRAWWWPSTDASPGRTYSPAPICWRNTGRSSSARTLPNR